MLITGEALFVCVYGGGAGGIWEIWILPSQFCYEPKITLK